MGELEKYYHDRINYVFNALKNAYANRLKNARDKIGVHNTVYEIVSKIYTYLQRKYTPYTWNLIYTINKAFDDNKYGRITTYDAAIIQSTREATPEERLIILFKIGSIRGYSDFINYLRKPETHQNLYPKANIANTVPMVKKIQLSDFFEDSSKYKFIMNLLVERGCCQQSTYIWKDRKNGSKGFLASILKHLHPQGYYQDNKRPTNKQIQEIAQNTFGLKISIDTIKRANHDVSFIPPASSVT